MDKIGYYDILKQIDKFIDENEISSAVFDLFVHKSVKDYFFKKIENISWFDLLREYSYFSSSNTPSLEPAEQEGYFSIPHWNVLYYLELVSKQVSIEENNKYIFDLIEIIKDVTLNGDSDNYRTWYSFAIILSNIPNEYITINDLKLFIPKWLGSKFDTSLPAKEISHRLLPKFDNPDDHHKARLIFDILTSLRPIPEGYKGKGFLSRYEVYMPVVDLYWLNDAIEYNSNLIGKITNKELIVNIKNKIENLLKKEKHERIFPVDDYKIIFSISEDENEKQYNINIFKSEKTQTNDLYEQFIESQKEQEDIKSDLITSFKINTGVSLSGFIETIFNELQLEQSDSLRENFRNIKIILKYFYLGLYDKWTYESLFNLSPTRKDEAIGVYHKILLQLITSSIEKDAGDIGNIFTELYNSKYLYFKKLCFYLFGKYYPLLNGIFWEYIKNDENDFFLLDNYFGDEIKFILEQVEEPDQEFVDYLDRKIDIEAAELEELKEDELFVKLWKQKYYKALSGIPYFFDKHEKLKEETKREPELGPAFSMGESRMGTGPSPVSVDDLERMSCEDIVSLLKSFRSDNTWDGLSEESLSDRLKELVKRNPGKISSDIVLFKDIAYKYVFEILSGFNEAWNNKISIDWEVILDFIEKYINRNEFWEDKLDIKGEFLQAKHLWVVNAFSELIESGVKSDDNAIPEKLNFKIIGLIEIILKNISDDNQRIDDPIGSSLNSNYGRLITSMILFSLREARLRDNIGYADNWESRIKPLYDSLLEDKVKDSYTLLGQYIANLHYIDASWAIEKINLMKKESGENWIFFMSGYFYTNKIYSNIYQLMRNHYLRFLKESFGDNTLKTLFINHVGFGYFRDLDKEGESLYSYVIKKWDGEDILHLIDYFWRQNDSLEISEAGEDKEIGLKKYAILKILNFWDFLYSLYKNKSIEEFSIIDKRILSSVTRLAVYIDEITETNINWLMQVAPFIEIDHHSYFIIEYLNNLKDKGEDKIRSAVYVCDIYLKFLDVYVPDFDKEHIRETIQYLYDLSSEKSDLELKEKVNDICNIYGQSGIIDENGREFLRDLYEKYNK